MMKDIAIYGAGGFGREVACLIRLINEAQAEPVWHLVGFFDDSLAPGTSTAYGPILGSMDAANAWPTPLSVAIAIGSPRALRAISTRIVNPQIDFPNLIAPNTMFLDPSRMEMGRGNIVCIGCSFSCNTRVGDFNQFNGFITMGHDSIVGSYNSFMPGVRISGEVVIGEGNFWGFNSGILQGTQVGNGCTIGAGSVVIRRPKDGHTYMGVPARIVRY